MTLGVGHMFSPQHGQNLHITSLIDCPTCGLNVESNHIAYLIDLLRARKLFGHGWVGGGENEENWLLGVSQVDQKSEF